MFLQGFNGDSYFTDSQWQDLNTLNFFTDSANSHDLRFGAYFQGSCFFLLCPAGWENTEILKHIIFFIDELIYCSNIQCIKDSFELVNRANI